MAVKVSLSVRGVDLRDPATYDQLSGDLAELDWKGVGPITLAVVYVEHGNPVWAAADVARRIAKTVDGASIVGVYDELVSASDVARRCEISAESVRLWTSGKRRGASRPFPAPRQVLSATGDRSTALYAWREVVAWVREVVRRDPDEGIDYLDDMQAAELGVQIADLARDQGWHPVFSGAGRESTAPIHAVPTEAVLASDFHEPDAGPDRLVLVG